VKAGAGEGNQMLSENLRSAGFEAIGEGFKAFWNPDGQATAEAAEFGRQFVRQV
jgi:flavorubredoxin